MSRRTVPFVLVGWACIGVGVKALLDAGRAVPPVRFAAWIVGAALVHDLLLAPAVLLVGAGLARAVPAPVRPTVVRLLVVLGTVVAFAWPLVAGWGVAPANPSIQPRDYGRGLLLTLLATSGVILVWTGARRACRRQRAASPGPSR